MAAFKFRLETLLRLKKLEEGRALERFSEAERQLVRCEGLLLELLRIRDEVSRSVSTAPNGLSAMEFSLVARQLGCLGQKIQEKYDERKTLQDEQQKRQEDLSSKVSERKSQEQFKERAFQSWRHELRKRDRKRMDEVGAQRAPARSAKEESRE